METPNADPPARPPRADLAPSSGAAAADPPRSRWRALSRSPRVAAGVVIAAAALLLWPFAGWSVIPWLAGIGVLVLLRLLRLDGLLRGWAPHLGGVVVVGGLMLSTGPWAWALAMSIGVLLAGLVRLPSWRLAAVGTALVVVTGAGFAVGSYEDRIELERAQARAGDPVRVQLGETRPARVLPAMLQAVALDDADPICRLLTPVAETAIREALRAPDCASAVAELNRRLPPGPVPDRDDLPEPQVIAGGWQVDGCATPWAQAAGLPLGRVTIYQTSPSVQRYAVAGFAPC